MPVAGSDDCPFALTKVNVPGPLCGGNDRSSPLGAQLSKYTETRLLGTGKISWGPLFLTLPTILSSGQIFNASSGHGRSDLVSHNLDSGFAAFLSNRVDLRHYVFAGEQDGNGIPDLGQFASH